MTKTLAATRVEALIDGLESLTLEDQLGERLSQADSDELSRSMQFILAASAARAKLDTAVAVKARTRSPLKMAVAIKVSELRSLLSPRSPTQLLGAALEGEESVDEKSLNALIDDVERVISSKRNA